MKKLTVAAAMALALMALIGCTELSTPYAPVERDGRYLALKFCDPENAADKTPWSGTIVTLRVPPNDGRAENWTTFHMTTDTTLYLPAGTYAMIVWNASGASIRYTEIHSLDRDMRVIGPTAGPNTINKGLEPKK
jgi:hypothetical protein